MSTPTPASPKPTGAERPLSPHLQVYKPQITTIMSILHRATGIGLTAGIVVFVGWLVALASGPECYNAFIKGITSPIGQIFLFGWTWAFFYHLCCGIRHLLWDAGAFLTIEGVYSTGRIATAVSALLTILFWLKAYGYEVCPWM